MFVLDVVNLIKLLSVSTSVAVTVPISNVFSSIQKLLLVVSSGAVSSSSTIFTITSKVEVNGSE